MSCPSFNAVERQDGLVGLSKELKNSLAQRIFQAQHEGVRKTLPSRRGCNSGEPRAPDALSSKSGYTWQTPPTDTSPPSRASILFKVELALARMESGEYGYCVICNDAISIEELDKDPSIVSCGACRPT